ncbi:hypothetical protein [Gordonia sp. NPDC003585]|uniref:hypothetical protein n=1 Tax=unclassified Gordonia (in: high G+C Gram-positive bacteria) TaxID=2657482 RepID=UPI0033A6C01E
MTFPEFIDHYSPGGSIRLGSWSMEPTHHDLVECRATFALEDRIMSLSAVASGPVGAMTSMLHEIGAPISIVKSHQRVSDGQITAFLLCERDDRQVWALGDGTTCDEANVNALVAGANRLLAGSE